MARRKKARKGGARKARKGGAARGGKSTTIGGRTFLCRLIHVKGSRGRKGHTRAACRKPRSAK